MVSHCLFTTPLIFQIKEIIEERDDLKSRLRRGQGDLSPMERSELERQLSATKRTLFEEQKSSRSRMEQLEEVRSNVLRHLYERL